MKKVINILLLGITLMVISSCYKKDNWPGPDARVYGRVMDSYTGEELLSSQGDWGIRIWERSWKESEPINQSLPVKQDGTYNNSKMFSGTYDMLPYGGAFFPVDTVKNVVINGITRQDFEVTPYLQLIDFETSLHGLKLIMKCRLVALRRIDLPNLVEIKPFLSLNTFCGGTSYINIPEYNDKRIQINKPWIEEMGDDVDTSDTYIIGPLDVKPGYTYYVRLGANVNDANRKYNYTKIVKIDVPADAVNDPNEIPDNYLSNAKWPFARADWDGTRWGNLAGGWITNEAMRTRNGMGGYDGGWEGDEKNSLGFEYWNDNETPIINGKLYQTIDLPAGDYRFTMSLGGDNPIISNSGNDPRYIVAAVGNTLPDIEDLSSALASSSFVGLANDGSVSIQFSLDQPSKVSVGFLVNFTNPQQNVRCSWLKLEKLF